jgi:hypothetical protein
MVSSPFLELIGTVDNSVVVEEEQECSEVLGALFRVLTVDTSEGRGGQTWWATAKEMIDVDVEEKAAMVQVYHVVVGKSSATDSIKCDHLGSKDVVDATACFACGDLGLRSVGMNEYVNQVVAKNEGIKFLVIRGIAEPGVKVSGKDDEVVLIFAEEG